MGLRRVAPLVFACVGCSADVDSTYLILSGEVASDCTALGMTAVDCAVRSNQPGRRDETPGAEPGLQQPSNATSEGGAHPDLGTFPQAYVPAPGQPFEPPELLSETGVFRQSEPGASIAGLATRQDLVEYDVQVPLYSDGTTKRRWLAVPQGTTIGFRRSEPWEFPVGTMFVKHFSAAPDLRVPEELDHLETRVLVAGELGEFHAATYRWLPDGSDAQLVRESEFIDLRQVDEAGQEQNYSYLIPGPSDCTNCHQPAVGFVLGVRTLQLHSVRQPAELFRDALFRLMDKGLLTPVLTDDEIVSLPTMAALDDESRTVEERVRSYLDSNCAHCHTGLDPFFVPFDARYSTPLAEQNMVWAPAVSPRLAPGALLVVPGEVGQSELYLRDSSVTVGERMPPLGRHRRDEVYLDLLRQWIEQLQGDERFPSPEPTR